MRVRQFSDYSLQIVLNLWIVKVVAFSEEHSGSQSFRFLDNPSRSLPSMRALRAVAALAAVSAAAADSLYSTSFSAGSLAGGTKVRIADIRTRSLLLYRVSGYALPAREAQNIPPFLP